MTGHALQHFVRSWHLNGVRSVSVNADDEGVVERFEAFYGAQRAGAIRLAWLMTHDASRAEDIVQDAFTEVYRRFDEIDNANAYLRRSIVNGVFQRSRREGRERRRLMLVAQRVDRSANQPVDEMIDVIATLPVKQRTAIVLRYWADLDDRSIAEALGVRPGTVRSLLSRSFATLRKEITS
jgi:RNA polymerase sigma factor (sigma-70 family)